MAKTAIPAPLNDRSYWRRLLATVHPDRDHGDKELFVFLTALREHVEECSRHREDPANRVGTCDHQDLGDHSQLGRIPYDAALGYIDEFSMLTLRAISVGQHCEEPFRSVLLVLMSCGASDHGRRAARQCRGASYKQLAAIGHRFGMDKAQRLRWYEVARSVPLSEAHAHHILSSAQEDAA